MNVNVFNSNCVICTLCEGCHDTYTCMQVQYMDQLDKCGQYNSYFDKCNSSWKNCSKF